mmetsp:Transcript_11891/g.32722  ORF Transcript_11891/g.32722 Transcript_11891/m.32722 type:complete len:215 (-) Transcript_11891:384-1028(-)
MRMVRMDRSVLSVNAGFIEVDSPYSDQIELKVAGHAIHEREADVLNADGRVKLALSRSHLSAGCDEEVPKEKDAGIESSGMEGFVEVLIRLDGRRDAQRALEDIARDHGLHLQAQGVMATVGTACDLQSVIPPVQIHPSEGKIGAADGTETRAIDLAVLWHRRIDVPVPPHEGCEFIHLCRNVVFAVVVAVIIVAGVLFVFLLLLLRLRLTVLA